MSPTRHFDGPLCSTNHRPVLETEPRAVGITIRSGLHLFHRCLLVLLLSDEHAQMAHGRVSYPFIVMSEAILDCDAASVSSLSLIASALNASKKSATSRKP
jgi:hypothetical protein